MASHNYYHPVRGSGVTFLFVVVYVVYGVTNICTSRPELDRVYNVFLNRMYVKTPFFVLIPSTLASRGEGGTALCCP